MEASPFIGSTIFFYILAVLVVMIIGGYLTYKSGQRKKIQQDKEDGL
ncbi:hypothetical protein [Psychrobacter aestuarii]|uniref:Uncharacterized protein n=1 Tax=Psychrobacter aestuarii TaxID=556327 RepID=A0ABN0VQ44_9GAMM|nr:hypothetical protein [Psychrobacter aestuarii]